MIRLETLEALTDFAVAIHEAPDAATVATLAEAALQRLISADGSHVLIAAVRGAGDAVSAGTLAARMPLDGQYDPDVLEQNPIYRSRLRRLVSRPARLGEFLSITQLRSSPLWTEYHRTAGIERMLQISNPGPYASALTLTRSSGMDFTADDVALMDAIGRHLSSALARLHARPDGAPWTARHDARVLHRFHWLVCDEQGTILRSDGPGLRCLRDCIAATGARVPATPDRVPPDMLAALRSRLAGHPPRVLHYAPAGRRIEVHLAPIRSCPGECTACFLEEDGDATARPRFATLGLTARESEVMHWLIEGKTNAEIGIILGVSPLTAKKHVENILHKLGVETRTAAVTRALESTVR
jgi:DNA-binding CsgD family transcriptional regulator